MKIGAIPHVSHGSGLIARILPSLRIPLALSCFADWLERAQFGLMRPSDVIEPPDILQNRGAVLCSVLVTSSRCGI